MQNKRVLVTGGAGFIGSHLCRKLLNKGYDVICLDNYFTGNKMHVLSLASSPRFELVRHDVTIPFSYNVDEIYNLACPASPVHYQSDPVKTLKTNVLGSINVLDLATQISARVLQASTSEVYGDPSVHPQPETYWGNVNPIGIRSCYDEGKRCAETLFFDYNRKYGTDIKVVRIFNTYGPMMNIKDGRVVSNFIIQALQNQEITIYGAGKQTRSFCYVDDLVEGLIRMMESDRKVIGPINLGNPFELSILTFANLIISMINSSSRIAYRDLPQDDPQQRRPNIMLAQKLLGWSPTISIEDGLRETIEYFRRVIHE